MSRRLKKPFSRHDRFISFGLLVQNQRGLTYIRRIVDAINAQHQVSRNIQQHNALALMVLNAIYHDYNPLIISLDNSSYKVSSRYNKAGVGSAAFQSVIKALHAKELIDKRYESFAGYKRKESTVIQILGAFREFCVPYHQQILMYLRDGSESVILRKTEKSKDKTTGKIHKTRYPCEYEDNAFSNAARAFLRNYNHWIRQPSMTLRIPVERQEEIFGGLSYKEIHERTDTYFNNRSLRRIFIAEDGRKPSDSTMPLPAFGGRFYGAYWIDNIPSAVRSFLYIDELPCVELDFRAMNVTMLYMMETGAPWTEYPYENIPVPTRTEEYFPKALVKPFFTWCINNKTRKEALGTLRAKLAKELKSDLETQQYQRFLKDHRLNYDQLIDATLDRHPAIRHRFFDGTVIGKQLQFHDSQIMERIMSACMQVEAYCLPVHDAIIVQKQHEKWVKNLMVKTLCEYFKVEFREPYVDLLVK